MPSFQIGSISHPTYGDMELHFQGPNRALIITKHSPDGCPPGKETTMVPRSLPHAFEILDEIASSGGYLPGGYFNLELMDWDRDELRAEAEQNEALPKDSIYVGIPSLGDLTQYLTELLTHNPSFAFYPVYLCGASWCIQIGKGRCNILLYPDWLPMDDDISP